MNRFDHHHLQSYSARTPTAATSWTSWVTVPPKPQSSLLSKLGKSQGNPTRKFRIRFCAWNGLFGMWAEGAMHVYIPGWDFVQHNSLVGWCRTRAGMDDRRVVSPESYLLKGLGIPARYGFAPCNLRPFFSRQGRYSLENGVQM